MTRESQQWEKELKEAGWEPCAAHPNSPMWRDPDGQLFPGPGYAYSVMKERKDKTIMSRPQKQRGYVYHDGKAFHIRFYVHENGVRKRRSRKLCVKDDLLHQSTTSPAVVKLAEEFMEKINLANVFNDSHPGHNCPICGNRCKRTIEQKFAPKVQQQGERFYEQRSRFLFAEHTQSRQR
jgi:hypothetical protein